MMGARHQGRIIAFQTLYRYEFTREDVLSLYDFTWLNENKQKQIKEISFDFARLIITGTIEHLDEIDRKIKDHLEHWDFSRLSKVDLSILRISTYSLLFQQDIPYSVSIDEAIDIAKEFGGNDSYKFINGVLDSIRKSQENFDIPP